MTATARRFSKPTRFFNGSYMTCFTESADGVIVNVKAQPRSSRSGIDGILGDALKIRVKCAPVDGKANKELTDVLAHELSLPNSSVVFKSGETSKTKRILIKGKTVAEVTALLKL